MSDYLTKNFIRFTRGTTIKHVNKSSIASIDYRANDIVVTLKVVDKDHVNVSFIADGNPASVVNQFSLLADDNPQ